MSTFEAARAGGLRSAKLWRYASRVFAALARRPARMAERPDAAYAARLFAKALADDSNLELDWLCCASSMVGAIERRYCLHRALAINPDSELAARALKRMERPRV